MGRFFEILKKIPDIYKRYVKAVFFEAASLSFYTIFTIIPMFMIVFSLFTSSPFFHKYYLNFQNFIYNTLLPGKTDVITNYIDLLVTNSSKLGLIGFFYGFGAAILFFINFEYLMNRIFHVEKQRDLWSSISTFWTLVGLVPLALIFSMYISFKLKNYFNITMFLPFLIVWFIFILIYAITPNRRVNRKAVIVTSFFSSVIWYIMRSIFISYIVQNKIYYTIYGSLSIILLLFIWIYISWIIIVGGAYVCVFLENNIGKIRVFKK